MIECQNGASRLDVTDSSLGYPITRDCPGHPETDPELRRLPVTATSASPNGLVSGPGNRAASVLGAQRLHWETTLARRPEMFGSEASEPARFVAELFRREGMERVLELGGGQGRDSLFLAASGFSVHVLDYAQAGVCAIIDKATQAGLADQLTATQHDVREPLPFPGEYFDACYSHMLFCMAFTTAELQALSREVLRVLRPGGLGVYTVRNTTDADYGRGVHRGEDLYENDGFIVHFFDRAKVELLAQGYDLLAVDELTEGKLPRRLYRVTLRKPG